MMSTHMAKAMNDMLDNEILGVCRKQGVLKIPEELIQEIRFMGDGLMDMELSTLRRMALLYLLGRWPKHWPFDNDKDLGYKTD